MKALGTTLAFLLLAASAALAQPKHYGWTISNNTTTALSNTGAIAPGPSSFSGNLYLWLACSPDGGATGAEFDVVELRGAGGPTSFTPFGGVFPQFVPPRLLLTFSGCANGPVLAGAFSVGPDAFTPDIELCIVPSAASGLNVSYDCSVVPQAWPNTSIGFAKTSPPSCVDALCQAPVSVGDGLEGSEWGRVKALYR